MSHTNTLLEKFHALPDAEKQILLSLAVLFSPIGQTRLQATLRELKCVDVKVYKQIAKPCQE